jgi:hypothetical protein
MLDPKYEFIKSHNKKVLEIVKTEERLKELRPKKEYSFAGRVLLGVGRILTNLGNFLLTRVNANQTT